MEQFDVVVVGGGIAGSSIAAALAPAGVSVLVLERQTTYRDKVRGEYMQPWGVAEMLRLGLEQTLLEAGGGYTNAFVTYGEHIDPVTAEASAIPLGMLLPDVPGAMCVGHPQASEALNTLAQQRGAHIVRGVGDVDMIAAPDTSPVVRYELDGIVYEVPCRLVIGADGRQSTVRRALGIPLAQIESRATLGGLLVKDADWGSDAAFLGNEGNRHFLAFPRPNGYVRLYLACEPGPATAGPERTQHMLDVPVEVRAQQRTIGERAAGRTVLVLRGHRRVDRPTDGRWRGAGGRCGGLVRPADRRRVERRHARRASGHRRAAGRRRLVCCSVRGVRPGTIGAHAPAASGGARGHGAAVHVHP